MVLRFDSTYHRHDSADENKCDSGFDGDNDHVAIL